MNGLTIIKNHIFLCTDLIIDLFLNFFNHLKEHSDFTHDEYVEKVKQEEYDLIKRKNINLMNYEILNLWKQYFFIIASVSVLQVINIFTNNIEILLISLASLIVISIFIIISRNLK